MAPTAAKEPRAVGRPERHGSRRGEVVPVRAEVCDIRVRIRTGHGRDIVKPVDATGSLPTVLYMAGSGWVLGKLPGNDSCMGQPFDADLR